MLIDVYACLPFSNNLDRVLDEIKQHQIITISHSVDLDSHELNCQVASRSRMVIPVFGVHPVNASKYSGDLKQLEKAQETSPLFGGVGLDIKATKDNNPPTDQKAIFEYFLKSALKQNKYVIVHSNGAFTEIQSLIEKHDIQKVIIHGFTGTQEVFKKLIDRGAFFSMGADVINSAKAQQLAKEIPTDQLLTATDNPLVSGISSNTITMPGILNDIVKALAQHRNTTEKDIVQTVERNFMAILQSIPSLSKFSKKIARDFKNRRGSRLR